MNILDRLDNKKTKLSVIGLGYVGLPVALAFDKVFDVVGYDNNSSKIKAYNQGLDPTNEFGGVPISASNIIFTNDPNELKNSQFHIVAVPTPINMDKTPDLTPVLKATEILAKHLKKGSYIVYESTVYPGATEDICIPLLEQKSGLKSGIDFWVGYSPERINPGDKVHTFETIKKIVSGQDEPSTNIIAKIYSKVVKAGVHKTSSIKAAESAKVVENSQRDINIAFMNELAMVFNSMGIDSYEVIKAMNTKWNALGFVPGLVGGHCIGVDPYYFIYQAEKLGYHSQIILSGRKVNEEMPKFVVDNTIKTLIKNEVPVKNANIVIFGLTFKENTNDIRNSKVFDIIRMLNEYDIVPNVIEPNFNNDYEHDASRFNIVKFDEITDIDAIIFAVAHNTFKSIELDKLSAKFKTPNKKILIDLKNTYNIKDLKEKGYIYWRL